MLDGTPYSGPSVDIWSMGIILYVFANGYLPFRDTNAADLYQAIRNGDFKDGEYSSTPCNLLIRKMIKPKSMDRPSIQEIAHDLWVNDGYIEVPKYTEAISSALSQFREVISDKLREYEMDHEKYDQMIKGRSLRHLQVFITIDSLMAKDISTTASSAANLSQVSPTPDSGYDGHIQVSVSDVVPSLSDLPHLKHASHDEAHEFTSCPQQSKMDHLEALSEAKEFISGPVPYISPTSMATPSLHTETKMQKFLRRFSRQPAEETKTGGGTKKGFSLFLKT